MIKQVYTAVNKKMPKAVRHADFEGIVSAEFSQHSLDYMPGLDDLTGSKYSL